MSCEPLALTPAAFDASVPAWVEYVESPAGKLRTAEILHYVRKHLPGQSLRVLDAGGGTGEISAALARDAHSVALLDFSPAMLDEAKRQCDGLDVNFVSADVSKVTAIFGPETFDVVLSHSLLEFVGDAQMVVVQLARVLRNRGVLSVVVGNRYHTPIRKALLQNDFCSALSELDAESPAKDLFGLPRRTLYPEAIRQMLEALGLRVIGEYGVRVFSDLLGRPPDDPEGLLALELAAGVLIPYRHIARFVQFVASKE